MKAHLCTGCTESGLEISGAVTDCKTATHYMRRGTLFKWYEEKIQDIKSHAREMLSGSFNSTEVHQLPDDDTRLLILTDLVTMERRNGSTSRADVVFVTPRIANI